LLERVYLCSQTNLPESKWYYAWENRKYDFWGNFLDAMEEAYDGDEIQSGNAVSNYNLGFLKDWYRIEEMTNAFVLQLYPGAEQRFQKDKNTCISEYKQALQSGEKPDLAVELKYGEYTCSKGQPRLIFADSVSLYTLPDLMDRGVDQFVIWKDGYYSYLW